MSEFVGPHQAFTLRGYVAAQVNPCEFTVMVMSPPFRWHPFSVICEGAQPEKNAEVEIIVIPALYSVLSWRELASDV